MICSPTPVHIPGASYNSKRYRHPNVHSSTVYGSKDKPPKYPLTDKWIKIIYKYAVLSRSVVSDSLQPHGL